MSITCTSTGSYTVSGSGSLKVLTSYPVGSVVITNTSNGYDGTYPRANTGHIAGSTFTLDTDTRLYSKDSSTQGKYDIIYSNDSSGWYAETVDSDPTTWTNGTTFTRDYNTETIDTTGYVTDGDGKYVPSTSSSKVDSFTT